MPVEPDLRFVRLNMEGPVKLGLMINTQFPEGDSVPARIPELVEQVRVARDAGMVSLWFPHHYLTSPLQMLQIAPMMAFLAAEARGMMAIGPNILILPLLNPVHVAEEAATLDVLTGGKYIMGVGLGYRAPEFDSFGIPLSERAPRFVEAIRLMRRLWTEDRVTFEGRFYSVKDHGIGLKPLRPGGPPIDIAAQVDAAIKRAARIGDAWLIVPSTSLDTVAQQMRLYRAALAEVGARRWNTRSRANAMSAPATPRRSRNAGRRWNTNIMLMRRGASAPRPASPSRNSRAIGSSSATRCQ